MLCVDDMTITGDDIDGITDLKSTLSHHFDIKDLGPLLYSLGIEVSYSEKDYLLSQSQYTTDIIEQSHLTDTRSVDSPLELNARYANTNGTSFPDPTLYRLVVVAWYI